MKANKQEYNDIPVFYCVKCLSLNIISENNGKDLYCADCGRKHSHPKYIDVTNIYKWQQLYMDVKGHHPLDAEPSIYDDLEEVYQEQAENPEPTKDEIIAEGLNYSEKMNRRIKD